MSLSSSLQIGEVIQNAVAFNAKNWQGGRDDLMNAKSLSNRCRSFLISWNNAASDTSWPEESPCSITSRAETHKTLIS